MANPETITILSLCTGYGGLELGLARALENPLRVVAVEVEAYALANLAAKAEEGKLAVEAMWPDLRTFPAEKFRGCFDFVAAGYPCQPFSCAGKRKGEKDPRHLWPDIARIVESVRPVWCFFENVAGHLTLGFAEVYCSLRNMGYSVEAGLFTAAECGAPHKRERLFILAKSTRRRSGQEYELCKSDLLERPSELADAKHTRLQGPRLRIATRRRELAWPAGPGQQQYEWEEPRTVVDAASRHINNNTTWEGSTCSNGNEKNGQAQSRLGGSPYGNTDTLDINRGIKNEELSILQQTNGEEKIQRKIGGQQGISEKKLLQSTMLPQSEDVAKSEHKHTKKTGIKKERIDMQQMRKCQECPKASPKHEQRQDRNIMSALPCGLAHCNGNVGAKENSMRIDRLRLLGNGVVPQQAELAFRTLMEKYR